MALVEALVYDLAHQVMGNPVAAVTMVLNKTTMYEIVQGVQNGGSWQPDSSCQHRQIDNATTYGGDLEDRVSMVAEQRHAGVYNRPHPWRD
jgi:hypothetical protein